MSSKYLSNMSQPNQAIDVRVHDLTVDGTFNWNIPDPFTVNDLDVTTLATVETLNFDRRECSTNAVTQLTSISTPVTLNTEHGVITTFTIPLPAGIPNNSPASFTLNNSLITTNTVINAFLVGRSGVTTDGYPIIQCFVTGAGTASVHIINAYTNVLSGNLKIFFELIHQI